MVAGKEYAYQPRPDLGYVIKLPASEQAIEYPDGDVSLFTNIQARRIGGLGQRRLWIVKQNGGASPALQSIQRQAMYVAPLFTLDGEKVAVIPEIVVRVTEDIRIEQLRQVCRSLGCSIQKPMEFTTQEYLLDVLGTNEEAAFSIVRELNKIDWIEWADLNVAFQPKPCGQTEFYPPQVSQISGTIPNDEFLPMQWHLHNTGQFGYTPDADINALEAWEITTGDPNIVIAIVDDGVDANHPDLVNNLVPGYDFLDDDESTYPERNNNGIVNNHGTMCAGLAAAQGNNYIGVMGATWNCKIMPVRIFHRLIEDDYELITNTETATAFRWAADHGADILSNSWSGANQIVQSAIIDITKIGGLGRDGRGCVVLAASGNHFDDDSTNVKRPAGFREAIAVGATTENDTLRDYSCYGPEVDISAPSGAAGGGSRSLGIMSTDISGEEGVSKTDYRSGCNGTSTATPITAGVVALMLSTEPDLTSLEVRHFLTRSARDLGQPGKDDYYGWGRVDARAALDMILAKQVDLNDDWKVDDADVALFDELRAANDPMADIGPAPQPDGVIDEWDLDLLMRYWGTEIPEMPGSEPGLIVRWALDETEGNIAHGSYDIYGDAPYPSDVHGGAAWQPESGIADGALQLDGVDDYISTPAILNPSSGGFSIFLWIKGGAPCQTIVSQESGVSWLMADPTDGALRTNLRTPEVTGRNAKPAGPPLICSTIVTDGDWHRVGLIRSSGERILYVDGKEAARDTAETLESAEGGLYIGASSALEPDGFFSGLIDEVRLYDRAVIP